VAPKEDVAEAPLPGTDRLLVVSYDYRRARDHPREILSPLQSEFTWVVRIVEERRRNEVARCEIHSWTGDFDGVFPAPDGSEAAVRWNDQTEAGLVLVELVAQPRQLAAAWDTRETNWLEGPAWTPESKRLVLIEDPPGAGPWWAEQEPGEADDDDVSPGGTFAIGSLVVLDRKLRERFRRRIDVELPPGWFPANDADRGLGAPLVVSEDDVVLRIPAEGDRRFTLGDV
jgi:hypothetical protein